MGLKNTVVKPDNPLQSRFEDHFFCDGFPVISEADDEEVIINFLEDFKKETGINVTRSMVPPAPNVDLYKPKKRKRNAKSSEEEPQKKEVKKEKEIVKEVEKKKGDKKRKAVGIKIDEERSKMRNDKKAKKNDSSTESDEETLAQKLKQ
ncbi:hypothetical protein A2U01_0047310, partial [Trifolium medium]|nr:hypothetical protein [Trifolium medium]